MKRASAAGGCIKTAIWAAQNIYLSKVGCSAADLFYRRVMTTDLPCLKRKINFDECIQQRVANQNIWRQNLENKRKTNESDILQPGEEVDRGPDRAADKREREVEKCSTQAMPRRQGSM
jgi:hypothetical protein